MPDITTFAYDDINLGGLGLASAEINRQVVTPLTPDTEMVAPAPDGSAEGARDGRSSVGPLSP